MLPRVAGCEGRGAGDLGFLELAFSRVGQQVVRIACAHDAGAGQRQRDARGVDRDPAAAPLLGDGAVVPEPQVGSRTRSPGSVVIRMQRSILLAVVLYDFCISYGVYPTCLPRCSSWATGEVVRKPYANSGSAFLLSRRFQLCPRGSCRPSVFPRTSLSLREKTSRKLKALNPSLHLEMGVVFEHEPRQGSPAVALNRDLQATDANTPTVRAWSSSSDPAPFCSTF